MLSVTSWWDFYRIILSYNKIYVKYQKIHPKILSLAFDKTAEARSTVQMSRCDLSRFETREKDEIVES